METLFRRGYSREEMTKRVARFKDFHGSDGGLPDSNMPGCERTLFNVIGFQPPKGEGDAVTSPVGGDAAGNVEHLDLDPLDVISFPPGAIRRFENVTPGDANQEHILMFVIGGDGPRAEFTDDSMK
ncbi:MAG: hypothetical protein ACXU84_20515, partial [Xanthobacteraceae bacterium]